MPWLMIPFLGISSPHGLSGLQENAVHEDKDISSAEISPQDPHSL
jgi:hypothetical protein